MLVVAENIALPPQFPARPGALSHNGDGKSDVLLRDSTALGFYQYSIAEMNGANVLNESPIAGDSVDASNVWQITTAQFDRI